MWVVEPDVRLQVETVLGAPLPDPSTPEFARLLRHLKDTQPDIATRLLNGLRTASSITLPSEAFLHRTRKRRLFQHLLTRCLYKPAWPDGVVLDKRRALGFALVLFAGIFLPIIYLLNGTTTALRPIPTSRLATAASTLGAAPGEKSTSIGSPTPRDLLPVPQVSPPSIPRSPASLPTSAKPVGGWLPKVPVPSSYASRQAPSSPFGTGPAPGLSAPLGFMDGSAAHVFAFVAADDRPQTSRVFVFSQSEEANREPTSGLSMHDGPPTSAPLYPLGERAGMPNVDAPLPHQQTVTTAPQLPVHPGQVVGAQLVTGIALAQGLEPSPLLAVSDGLRWCGAEACPQVAWLGHATYSGGNRVHLQISAALMHRRMYAVRAVALGPDMITGLPAVVSAKTPAFAAQVIAAALTAANDSLRVLGQQQQVTITKEGLTVTQSASPDFWAHLLSRITEVVGISPSRQAAEVAEVAPMTELRLLILAAEGR